MNKELPVIIAAFANDRADAVRYLRNLPEEARQLKAALANAESLCQLVVIPNATLDEIVSAFQKYRSRVAIFHYGGHANGFQLLLETSEGHAKAAGAAGLAHFLGHQSGLQLVFLNGCSTEKQTDALLKGGVDAVIATTQSIDDGIATQLSARFYKGLASGATINASFHEAVAEARAASGGEISRLLIPVDGEIDDIKSDRWPWFLRSREGSRRAIEWSLPEAADNPLFGLPELPLMDLPKQPFRHLHRFRAEDAPLFFGRGHDIRNMYQRITSPDAAPVMLYYGPAGVGKSSLLDAGLIPRLGQNYEVVYVRRDVRRGLTQTLRQVLLPEGNAKSPRVSWSAKEKAKGKPLVVILDQVEEAFTKPCPNDPTELAKFAGCLRAIFGDASRRPKGRIVLGFRKEWFAEIDEHFSNVRLPYERDFIERLDRRGIIEAIRGPADDDRLRKHYRLTIEDGLADTIADDLLADPNTPVAPTLQILLTRMWAEAVRRSPRNPKFDKNLYHTLQRAGILLDKFLEQQIRFIQQQHPGIVESGFLLDLLGHHTTPLGTSAEHPVEMLKSLYPHQVDDGLMSRTLALCQESYLITISGEGDSLENQSARLVHDTLAPIVRAKLDESNFPGQRARRILDNRILDWLDGKEGAPLDAIDLQIVEEGQLGTRAWNQDEQRLIKKSQGLREQVRVRNRLLIAGGIFSLLCILVAAGMAIAKSSELAQANVELESRKLELEGKNQELEGRKLELECKNEELKVKNRELADKEEQLKGKNAELVEQTRIARENLTKAIIAQYNAESSKLKAMQDRIEAAKSAVAARHAEQAAIIAEANAAFVSADQAYKADDSIAAFHYRALATVHAKQLEPARKASTEANITLNSAVKEANKAIALHSISLDDHSELLKELDDDETRKAIAAAVDGVVNVRSELSLAVTAVDEFRKVQHQQERGQLRKQETREWLSEFSLLAIHQEPKVKDVWRVGAGELILAENEFRVSNHENPLSEVTTISLATQIQPASVFPASALPPKKTLVQTTKLNANGTCFVQVTRDEGPTLPTIEKVEYIPVHGNEQLSVQRPAAEMWILSNSLDYIGKFRRSQIEIMHRSDKDKSQTLPPDLTTDIPFVDGVIGNDACFVAGWKANYEGLTIFYRENPQSQDWKRVEVGDIAKRAQWHTLLPSNRLIIANSKREGLVLSRQGALVANLLPNIDSSAANPLPTTVAPTHWQAWENENDLEGISSIVIACLHDVPAYDLIRNRINTFFQPANGKPPSEERRKTRLFCWHVTPNGQGPVDCSPVNGPANRKSDDSEFIDLVVGHADYVIGIAKDGAYFIPNRYDVPIGIVPRYIATDSTPSAKFCRDGSKFYVWRPRQAVAVASDAEVRQKNEPQFGSIQVYSTSNFESLTPPLRRPNETAGTKFLDPDGNLLARWSTSSELSLWSLETQQQTTGADERLSVVFRSGTYMDANGSVVLLTENQWKATVTGNFVDYDTWYDTVIKDSTVTVSSNTTDGTAP
ncbi:MAG: CHAT domain-containing protein [Planctomycetaceae bacterium]